MRKFIDYLNHILRICSIVYFIFLFLYYVNVEGSQGLSLQELEMLSILLGMIINFIFLLLDIFFKKSIYSIFKRLLSYFGVLFLYTSPISLFDISWEHMYWVFPTYCIVFALFLTIADYIVITIRDKVKDHWIKETEKNG